LGGSTFVNPFTRPDNGFCTSPRGCEGGVGLSTPSLGVDSAGFVGLAVDVGSAGPTAAAVVTGFGAASGAKAPGCMAAARTLLTSVTMVFATTVAALFTTPTAVWMPATAARSGLPLFANSRATASGTWNAPARKKLNPGKITAATTLMAPITATCNTPRGMTVGAGFGTTGALSASKVCWRKSWNAASTAPGPPKIAGGMLSRPTTPTSKAFSARCAGMAASTSIALSMAAAVGPVIDAAAMPSALSGPFAGSAARNTPGSCSVVVMPVVTVCASSGQMSEQ